MTDSTKERPLALFYAGTNGSGKSTLREIDDTNRIQKHIDPDAIARKMNAGNPRAADAAAGREAIKQFKEAIDTKTSFSMETTLTGKGVLKRMEEAKAAGFEVEVRYVGLNNADKNVIRVSERVARGGHHIDENVIRRRYSESIENLSKAIVIADKVSIRDNSGIAIVEHVEIENNKITCLTEHPPAWIREVVDRERERIIEAPHVHQHSKVEMIAAEQWSRHGYREEFKTMREGEEVSGKIVEEAKGLNDPHSTAFILEADDGSKYVVPKMDMIAVGDEVTYEREENAHNKNDQYSADTRSYGR